MATKKGIDISYYQGNINYEKVAQNVDFIILREGYRKTIDTAFLRYAKGLRAAGAKIPGVYHFIYAMTVADAKLEAQSCIANVQKAGLPMTTRIWADMEYDSITKAKNAGVIITAEMANDITVAFCETIKAAGYPTGIYTNNDWIKNWYTKETISKYPLWLADYTGAPDHECLYQQYTSDGYVDGISGSVDMDYSYEKEDEEPVATNTVDSVIESATKWMENLASDSSHGYDQIYRWGEKGDYDCSSAVITAWEQAGVKVKTAGATYTGNMYNVFLNNGFKDVTSLVTLSNGSGLKRGDVLLNIRSHVAMYVGDGKEVEASINEKGTATGGTPGDQTGREILVRSYRNYPWNKILRFTNGEAISTTTSAAASHSTVRYGSTGDEVKTLQNNLNQLGYSLDVDGDFGSKTLAAVRDFQNKNVLTVDGIVGPATWAKLDTLVAAKQEANAPSKEPKWVGRVTASSLNVRTGPSTDYGRVAAYPQLGYGNLVDVCDEVTNSSGNVWYYIRIGGSVFGYVSSKYVTNNDIN